MRETLLDALAGDRLIKFSHGVFIGVSQMQLLKELVRRGLVTSDSIPVLTESGIDEAKWFANQVNEKEDGSDHDRPDQ
jgi:hypothetical protein